MVSGSTTAVVFRNGLLIDGSGPEPTGQVDVLVEKRHSDGSVRGTYQGR